MGLDQFFVELRAAAINPPAVIFVNPKPQGLTPFFSTAEVITLSLTFDHKVINGAGAAAFLQDVKREMETFTLPA